MYLFFDLSELSMVAIYAKFFWHGVSCNMGVCCGLMPFVASGCTFLCLNDVLAWCACFLCLLSELALPCFALL